jgi:hypothetical protein
MHTRVTISVCLLALVHGAASAGAQVPNASAPAFGMSGNYAALARGYDAVAWNPALLGLADNPLFSFSTASIGGFSALKPIDMSAVKPYEGKNLPVDVREAWLAEVTSQGGENGRAEGGLTVLGLSVGHLAFQVATSGYADANLSPDAFEAVMFGNAGRTGTPHDLSFAGSSIDGAAFTTGAASFGLPTPLEILGGRLSLGITGKYVLGNAMARGQDDGSSIAYSGSTLRFPVVYADPSEKMDHGHGMGVDLGAAWSVPGLTVSATIQNVVNGFRWDTTGMYAKMVSGSFDGTTTSADVIDVPYDSASAGLRSAIANTHFAPVMAAGVALSLLHGTTVTADVRRAGAGMVTGPRSSIGVGIESKILSFLPLRGGLARVDGGWQAAAGLGVHVFAFELAISGATRQLASGSATGVMLGLVSVGR